MTRRSAVGGWAAAVMTAAATLSLLGTPGGERPPAHAAQSTTMAVVTGVVFEDRNGDGVRGEREPGIPGVSVSDGATIVRTDGSGRYRLETDPDRRITALVFITQPAGYAVPTDEYMTPRFYRELGELSGGAEVSVDFPLRPLPASRRSTFTFAHLSDTHQPNGRDFADQLAEIGSTSEDLAFIQISGDLTDNGTAEQFEVYRSVTATSSLPVWPTVGNHDIYNPGETYAEKIENYRRHLGPEWYSFDYGNRHFLVLENNGHAPFEEQWQWAVRDLELSAAGKRVVVMMHQPMNIPFGAPSSYDRYAELLSQYHTELLLVGHLHANDVRSDWLPGADRQPLHVTTTSAFYTINHGPRGFRFVRLRPDRAEVPFRVFGFDQHLTVVNPAPDAEVSATALQFQVSAYRTADEVVQVHFRVDDRGPWRPMRPSGEFTWISRWTGQALAPGTHTIEVEAVSTAGDRWARAESFRVTDAAPVIPRAGVDWPQHHGDERHSGVAKDWVGPDLRLAWSYRTAGSFLTGSPIIYDGMVYAATRDESGTGHAAVHAVDLETGRRRWTFPADTSIQGSIAAADGHLYAQSLSGTLYALDARTGSLVWHRTPPPALGSDRQRTYGYYGVTVASGTVFWTRQDRFGIGSTGAIAALDHATGERRWESSMLSSTMANSTPVVADGLVFVGNGNGDRMLAYDVDTGERVWTATQSQPNWQDGVPAVADGRVYIGANVGVTARDAATGEHLWTFKDECCSYTGSSTPSTPAVSDGVVYMGFPTGRIKALDAATGTELWSMQLPGRNYLGGVHSSPVVSGELVFVGSNNGHLYALDRATGEQRWAYEIGTWVSAGPAISGNTVVVGAWDGNLYAFAG